MHHIAAQNTRSKTELSNVTPVDLIMHYVSYSRSACEELMNTLLKVPLPH